MKVVQFKVERALYAFHMEGEFIQENSQLDKYCATEICCNISIFQHVIILLNMTRLPYLTIYLVNVRCIYQICRKLTIASQVSLPSTSDSRTVLC
jgi:hypothetical protein